MLGVLRGKFLTVSFFGWEGSDPYSNGIQKKVGACILSSLLEDLATQRGGRLNKRVVSVSSWTFLNHPFRGLAAILAVDVQSAGAFLGQSAQEVRDLSVCLFLSAPFLICRLFLQSTNLGTHGRL